MKFTILALLGLVTINAVKIHQTSLKGGNKGEEMPSVDEIFELCNTDDKKDDVIT